MQQKLLVIPSIDIKNGKCVRTVEGIPELEPEPEPERADPLAEAVPPS